MAPDPLQNGTVVTPVEGLEPTFTPPADRSETKRDSRVKTGLLAGSLILAVAVLIFLPIMRSGFPFGHDTFVHYRWLGQFREALAEPGVFYPYWLGSANRYQGSPVTLYYPPLQFFVATAAGVFVSDDLQALSLSCWLALLLSGLAMYVLCRRFFSVGISLFGAVLYLLAPYHLIDLYHRAAVGEFWAFVWVPLVFDAVYRLVRRPSAPGAVYLAFAYAALLLTHIPVAFALTVLLPVYVLGLSRAPRHWLQVGAGLTLGAGVSAIFLLPMLFERGYVRIFRTLGIRFGKYFLFEQLREPPLFQMPEPLRLYLLKLIDIGAFWFPLALVLAAGVMWWSRAEKPADSYQGRFFLTVWVITLLTFLMTLRVTTPIWEAVPQIANLQFPFRWLTIATVGAVLFSCLTLRHIVRKGTWRTGYAIAGGLALALLLANSWLAVRQAPYDRDQILALANSLEVPEYRPVWWDQPRSADREVLNADVPPGAAIREGEAELVVLDDEGVDQRYSVRAATAAVIEFRTLYFPGWTAYLNGARREVAANERGRSVLAVEPGEHALLWRFEDTRPRRAGKIISALSLGLALAILLFYGRGRRFITRPQADAPGKAL